MLQEPQGPHGPGPRRMEMAKVSSGPEEGMAKPAAGGAQGKIGVGVHGFLIE